MQYELISEADQSRLAVEALRTLPQDDFEGKLKELPVKIDEASLTDYLRSLEHDHLRSRLVTVGAPGAPPNNTTDLEKRITLIRTYRDSNKPVAAQA